MSDTKHTEPTPTIKRELNKFVALFTMESYFDYLVETAGLNHLTKDQMSDIENQCIFILDKMHADKICSNNSIVQFKQFVNTKCNGKLFGKSADIPKLLIRFCENHVVTDTRSPDQHVIDNVKCATKQCSDAVNELFTMFYDEVVDDITRLLTAYPFEEKFVLEYLDN
jgi:hypothetical protein